jgi:hypothetical protein
MEEYHRGSQKVALESKDYAESETLMHGHIIGGLNRSFFSRLRMNNRTHCIINSILTTMLTLAIISTWVYGNIRNEQQTVHSLQDRYYCT